MREKWATDRLLRHLLIAKDDALLHNLNHLLITKEAGAVHIL